EAAAGDQLQPNQTILTLFPLQRLYLRTIIPGTYGLELRRALDAGERLTASGEYAGKPLTAVLERLAGEADARGVEALLQFTANGVDLPLGAFVHLQLERPIASASIALPFSALHGGDRIFAVDNGRLRSVTVERIGELAGNDHESGLVLLRAPTLAPAMPVMVTHLPNAVDGLKVEIVQ
ncbi:MAG: RND transporter, partial [Chromatium okenii]|nr:RND transporter [Chromatium okenii]